MNIVPAEQKEFTIRQEGDRVLLILNGRLVASMPWQAAESLAKAIRIQAKSARNFAQRDRLIFDQAILMRTGFPVGLSDHPYILREAAKEAAWNSDLRRYIPPARAGGIASQATFGKARIIQHAPKENNDGRLDETE